MRTLNILNFQKQPEGSEIIYLGGDDIEDGVRSCAPGEWCFFKANDRDLIGFVNPFSSEKNNIVVFNDKEKDPRKLIERNISNAIKYRAKFSSYTGCSRLIYGEADLLPGLICDEYENVIVLQINRAGLDQHREFIRGCISKRSQKKVVIFDSAKERAKEGLPDFQLDELPEEVKILDSGISYSLNKKQFQKNGYYYDHRENRLKLESFLEKLNESPTKGLDLFCYLGSWGFHALRANVEHMTFVDQANMQENIVNTAEINKVNGSRFEFIRDDVFKCLDKFIASNKRFDLIISDPPAFAKSFKSKKSALQGYDKLNLKLLSIADDCAYIVVASCTKYVDLKELDQSFKKSAKKASKKVRLLDIGTQGYDHPISSLDSRNNYIKYLLYFSENV